MTYRLKTACIDTYSAGALNVSKNTFIEKKQEKSKGVSLYGLYLGCFVSIFPRVEWCFSQQNWVLKEK